MRSRFTKHSPCNSTRLRSAVLASPAPLGGFAGLTALTAIQPVEAPAAAARPQSSRACRPLVQPRRERGACPGAYPGLGSGSRSGSGGHSGRRTRAAGAPPPPVGPGGFGYPYLVGPGLSGWARP